MSQPATLQGEQMLARFAALNEFLLAHQALWRPRPFTYRVLPWEHSHPELGEWLRKRTLEDAEQAQLDPYSVVAPLPYPQLAEQARQLAALGGLSTAPPHLAAPRLNVDVPGRKWQQIEAFAAHLPFREGTAHWLDWCAGKGHLGRRLLAPGQQLTCLEYDPNLVAAGSALSQHHQLSAHHLQQDVMAADARQHVHAHHTPVALHACGDLHVRLIELASQARCPQLAIVPCCYNRIGHSHYRPLSRPAQASELTLDLLDLSLPASEAVTAGARVRRQRDQSMARRLGFDVLQRQLRGLDDYLPTPSLPSTWLDKPFAAYGRDLAALKALDTSGVSQRDWDHFQQAGWQRLAQVRNLELLRNLFRRPLELWLALDRCLMLQENGYDTELGTFCPATLTPRNLMIRAQRQPVDNSVRKVLE
ncbi:methyltransferase [Pseudomonas sp. dw_358]|uniref:methyltransferase n=1 Tax=Pseudomonas sp. dw_358 TaxID=2720083 RepID=UPI001BD5353C|nr:methyltransferase [Pseudomonas sp. dw_358]